MSEVVLRPSKEDQSEAGKDDKPQDAAAPAANASASTDPIAVALTSGRWWLAPAAGGDQNPAALRWRHEAVEQAVQDKSAGQLRTFLAAPDVRLRTNAAIALVRLHDRSAATVLAASIANQELETDHRCAAIESLAAWLAQQQLAVNSQAAASPRANDQDYLRYRAALTSLLAELAVDPPPEGYQPALHAELLLAASKNKLKHDPALLATALASASGDVRAAALQYYEAQQGALPQAAIDLRSDPDPHVRIAALSAIAGCRAADAESLLSDALRDSDFHVHLAAIGQLGQLGTQPARALLAEQLKDRGELIRAAAVRALAAAGDWRRVLSSSADTSWRVRRAVAQAIAQCANDEAASVARKLLRDQSPDVESAVVDSIAQWPADRAAPLLLAACDHLAVSTRSRAREKLVAIWPAAKVFNAHAPPERRAEILAELQDQLAIDLPPPAAAPGAPGTSGPPAAGGRLGELQQLIVAIDREKSSEQLRERLAQLSEYGKQLLPALDQLTRERNLYLRDEVFTQTLPPLDPIFGTLHGMQSADVNERRRVSSALADQMAECQAPELTLSRLADQIASERDSIVWINVWRAVNNRDEQPITRLAYMAIDHPAPEVRRQACSYLAHRPSPRHAVKLFPLLADPASHVAIAAAMALGYCGPLDDPAPLALCLESRDPGLRFAAAVSLSRLGEESGRAALARFTFEGDSDLRRETAKAMGELKDQAFVPELIRLLDDRNSVRRVALAALNSIVGAGTIQKPGSAALSYDEQARRWRAWWHEHQNEQALPIAGAKTAVR